MINTTVKAGQKCWTIENDQVNLSITELGGMTAPVTFFRKSKNPVHPFHITPWAEENPDMTGLPGVLGPLRGDFFCLPFGGNDEWNGESHPPHGEIAENSWKLIPSDTAGRIEMEMETSARPGKVVKIMELKSGENNIYIDNVIRGFAGPTSLGYHPMFPGGSRKYISTSPILFGLTDERKPVPFLEGEYFSLIPGKEFSSLKEVPTIWKDSPFTDCTVFPAREGFIDHLQVFNDPACIPSSEFAWTAVSCPEEEWVWFGLKDPGVLPSTLLWIENRGRHQHPWNGRNSCIGVEDVCSFLAHGLKASVEVNTASKKGFRTFHDLTGEDFHVRFIQGAVRISENFTRVKEIRKADGGIEIESEEGEKVFTRVRTGFLND